MCEASDTSPTATLIPKARSGSAVAGSVTNARTSPWRRLRADGDGGAILGVRPNDDYRHWLTIPELLGHRGRCRPLAPRFPLPAARSNPDSGRAAGSGSRAAPTQFLRDALSSTLSFPLGEVHISTTTYPLYDPSSERDACGVGFIADRALQASHRMLRYAVRCLVNLDHRGAVSADGTGDGAGLLTQVPYRLLARELETRGIPAPSPGWLGVVFAFLPADDPAPARSLLDGALEHEGLRVLHWRTVPIDPAVLGKAAQGLDAPDRTGPGGRRTESLRRRRSRAAAVPGPQERSADRQGRRHPGILDSVQFGPNHRVQGIVHRSPHRGLLSRFRRSRLRDGLFDFSSAVLDEHRSIVGACPAVPDARPQRRDQHHQLQSRLDGSSPGRSAVAAVELPHAKSWSRSWSRARATVGTSTTPSRCWCGAAVRWPTSRRC